MTHNNQNTKYIKKQGKEIKVAREKYQVIYKGSLIRITFIFFCFLKRWVYFTFFSYLLSLFNIITSLHHSNSFLQALPYTVGFFPSLEDCNAISGTMKAVHKEGGGFQFSFISKPLGPVFEVHYGFNNRDLPFISEEQPNAITKAFMFRDCLGEC